MRRFKTFLNERKQVGIIYHFSTLLGVIQIINSNCLKGSDLEEFGSYSISFTRDKNFLKTGKREDQLGKNLLAGALEINGDSLSDKYKIKPFQFQNDMVDDENEERVRVEKIEGIKKYITKILIFKKKINSIEPSHLIECMAKMALEGEGSNEDFLEARAEIIKELYGRIKRNYFGQNRADETFYYYFEDYKEIFFEIFYKKLGLFAKKNNIELEIKESV